RGT
ncbi:hypothetical protein D027_3033, partial [Vibrio parahaemolyticus 861]